MKYCDVLYINIVYFTYGKDKQNVENNNTIGPITLGKILPATAIPSLSKKQQTYCVFHALLFGQYGLQYS